MSHQSDKSIPTVQELTLMARTKGILTHNEVYDWLTKELGFKHRQATETSRLIVADSPKQQLYNKQISQILVGKNADWRPAIEELLGRVQYFSPEITSSVEGEDIVLARSGRVFAALSVNSGQVQIAMRVVGAPFDNTYREVMTNTPAAILGLTHVIIIIVGQQVNDELISWLRQAYEQASI